MIRIVIVCLFCGSFIGLDLALGTLVPPHYRENADHARIINEYHSNQFRVAKSKESSAELLFLGDSRTRYNVNPEVLYQETSIDAFNLSIDGAGVATIEALTPVIKARFRKVKTLVWGISPRIFNVAWKDRAAERLTSSLGFKNYLGSCNRAPWRCEASRHLDELVSVVSNTYAHRSIIRPALMDVLFPRATASPQFQPLEAVPMNARGFMPLPTRALIDTGEANNLKAYKASHERGWFKWNKPIYKRFQHWVANEMPDGVNLVLFIPPMHYSFAELPTADHDVTPDAQYGELVKRLTHMADANPRVTFVDFNRDGANEFTDSHWGNYDHLNADGAAIFTHLLGKVITHAH